MRSRQALSASALLFLAAVGAALWLTRAAEDAAPPLALHTLDGRTLHLEQLRGKPLLVTFWATTCQSCVKEIPHLAELYQALHPRGLEVIGIAMAYDPPSFVLDMIQQRQIPYPIALDLGSAAAKSFGDVKLTPSSFLISPEGRIVQRYVGTMDMQRLYGMIQGML